MLTFYRHPRINPIPYTNFAWFSTYIFWQIVQQRELYFLRGRLGARFQAYNQRIDRYIEKYSSLVKYAGELAFPAHHRGMPDDAKKWGWLRKAAHRMSHPFTIVENGVWDFVGYIFFAFLMQMNLGWGLMFLAPALLGSPVFLSFANIGSTISLILAFICALPLCVVSYYWFYVIFNEKNTFPRLPYILMGVDLFLILGFSYAIRNESVTKHFIVSTIDIIPFLISFTFFLIPAITYFLIISFELLVQIKQLITSISRNVKTIHDPLPLEQIKKLAVEEIPATDGRPA